MNAVEIPEEPALISFAEFLEQAPPNTYIKVRELAKYGPYPANFYPLTPELQLHCPGEMCNGSRVFRCLESVPALPVPALPTMLRVQTLPALNEKQETFIFLTYICGNCQKQRVVFSLLVKIEGPEVFKGNGGAFKLGQFPQFGPPVPTRLMKFVGPDRELLLRGRQCENQGLGLGAFTYYRRVVESQKNRILDEIIKASQKVNAGAEFIASLETAKGMHQFSRAIDSIKDGFPQTLLIQGINPLTLLHSALSDGLHDQSDEHCLKLASSIRLVLGELAERVTLVLKDEAELNSAVAMLRSVKNKQQSTMPETTPPLSPSKA